MGSSGSILKKREDIHIERLIEDINTAAIKANLCIYMNDKVFSKDNSDFEYVTFNIFDAEKKQEILLYLFSISDDDYDEEFDWIIKGEKLLHIINIEDIYTCEKLVLDFIYEYLCLNNNDIFWDEQNWFYDYNSINLIKKREFDNEWCYKPFKE